jgi:hypothetical protein
VELLEKRVEQTQVAAAVADTTVVLMWQVLVAQEL